MFHILALTPEQNTLTIGLSIAILGVISPLLLARLVARNARSDKELDWARQDEVAARAENVAKQAATAAALVVERQIALDAKTDEVARLAAEQNSSVDSQLKKIHALVNSDMTAARRDELIRTKEVKSVLERIMRINKNTNQDDDLEDLDHLEKVNERIEELRAILADRAQQQRIVDEQVVEEAEEEKQVKE